MAIRFEFEIDDDGARVIIGDLVLMPASKGIAIDEAINRLKAELEALRMPMKTAVETFGVSKLRGAGDGD